MDLEKLLVSYKIVDTDSWLIILKPQLMFGCHCGFISIELINHETLPQIFGHLKCDSGHYGKSQNTQQYKI